MEDSTTLAAWGGLVLSTISLIWHGLVWRNRTAISIAAFPDTPPRPQLAGVSGDLVLVHVTNVGDRAVSLRCLYVRYFPSWPARLLGKHAAQGLLLTGKSMEPLPKTLKPGEVWEGWLQQDKDVVRWLRHGHLVLEAVHSMSSRPARHRVQR
jgi:hypothetical protein